MCKTIPLTGISKLVIIIIMNNCECTASPNPQDTPYYLDSCIVLFSGRGCITRRMRLYVIVQGIYTGSVDNCLLLGF